MYKIKICLSVDRYTSKPTRDAIDNIRFQNTELSIDEFINCVADGYAFTALMKDNWRNKENFICSNMLVYDIDHSNTEMSDYIENLPIKPTIAYTSCRNGVEGYGYGFRLIYCFSNDFCSLDEYKYYSIGFAKQLGLTNVDAHSHLGFQMWFGNVHTTVLNTSIIYSKINFNFNEFVHSTSESATQSITTHTNHNSLTCTFEIDETVKEDYFKLSFQEFIKKYSNVYQNIEKTPVEMNDESIIYYPNNYYEIRRPWKRINGEVMKIQDGEGRRKKLYLNGIIRRKINPDITFENMLYNLVYEFEYYYINNGNIIDKKTIFEITNNVMKADIIDSPLGKPKHKFFVNPLYCIKYNLSPKQVLGMTRNKKQYIGEFYDFSKTDNENLEIMKEYGLDISLRTLKTWKKENGITKYKKKRRDYLISPSCFFFFFFLSSSLSLLCLRQVYTYFTL